MIPIKDLIRDGCWLKCTVKDGWTFQIRLLDFRRLDYTQVDRPEKATPIEEGAVRWLMELEVVNTSKVHVRSGDLVSPMRVVDNDGFEFEHDRDYHLCCVSAFAKVSGLTKFFGEGLMPKVKIRGAVLFKVPDEDTEYSLAVHDGTIEEI